MIDQDHLNAATLEMLHRGIRVLQGFRLAPSDEEHVGRLLDYMAPAKNTTVVDIGCGFGEVARLMHVARPDVDFILLNNNALQLHHAPSEFPRVMADMHDLPLADASVDGAMFCYSYCHGDPVRLLSEAARVVRPGGELFVFDYVRVDGDNGLFQAILSASAYSLYKNVRYGQNAGWQLIMADAPDGSDALFRGMFETGADYDLIFADLVPAVWKMRRT